MRFDDLDQRLRLYETAYDFCVPLGNYIVVRLDGRGFTRLTKTVWQFAAPFDIAFRDLMAHTTRHLMQCGFHVIYAYSQSDEISLLFHLDEQTFKRKSRKIISILAAEASAHFSLAHGQAATFDARISILPNSSLVEEYFLWRQEDAHRNALNAHCYWLLRQQGQTAYDAAATLRPYSRQQKHDLLFQHGINFNDVPLWQKRGFTLYWQTQAKTGFNPQTHTPTHTTRRVLHTDFHLPCQEDYRLFLHSVQSLYEHT